MAKIEAMQWETIGMTVQETANALRVSVRTVLDAIKNDGLPARKVGYQWRIDPGAVKAWLAAGPATADCLLEDKE